MSGPISAGGLITGLDSGALIESLMQLERAPIFRIQQRISDLELQQTAVRGLRTTLQGLRNNAQDFRFSNTFSSFLSTTSDDTVLTAEVSSSTPVTGAFEIDVTQLATATAALSSSFMGAAIDENAALDSSGITTEIEAGTFTINGVEITVDPAVDSLSDMLSDINSSAAGVTATYDSVTDTVTFTNTTVGDTSIINFGDSADDGESNFLEVLAVTEATQSTNSGTGSTEVTSTVHLGVIASNDTIDDVSFAGGAVTSGSFSINGIAISVDTSSESVQDIIESINASDAQVTASFDSSTDTIRIVSDTFGSRTINFGSTSDTSNFLTITNLASATQTAGNDAEFTVNGGSTLTRNTNKVSNAISGVTLSLLSVGSSTVTVSEDIDSIVESIQGFVEEFNSVVSELRGLTSTGGVFQGDGSIRSITDFLRTAIFDQVEGASGDFESLIALGITTGEDFDPGTPSNLEIDEDSLREALREDPSAVEFLFSNADKTGIADIIFDFLDEATQTTGFLNARAKSNGTIDVQIRSLNDQIDRIEDRLVRREDRLRRQFTNLEQLSAGFQNQGAALAGLRFGGF